MPEFVTLSWLVSASGTIDALTTDAERERDLTKTLALADHWILGLFEILRIVSGPDYRAVADTEFTAFADLKQLHRQVNMVRSSFAKLKAPGKNKYVLPSHSTINDLDGVVFAVFDEVGSEVNVGRRGLADAFLTILAPFPPSPRMVALLRSKGKSIDSVIVPVRW